MKEGHRQKIVKSIAESRKAEYVSNLGKIVKKSKGKLQRDNCQWNFKKMGTSRDSPGNEIATGVCS
jgi:hypothetical protein